jgi:hypothetical protein
LDHRAGRAARLRLSVGAVVGRAELRVGRDELLVRVAVDRQGLRDLLDLRAPRCGSIKDAAPGEANALGGVDVVGDTAL